MHESEKWKWSRSVVSDPQRPDGLQTSRLLCPWDFPGKSAGVGCHCLLWESLWVSAKQEWWMGCWLPCYSKSWSKQILFVLTWVVFIYFLLLLIVPLFTVLQRSNGGSKKLGNLSEVTQLERAEQDLNPSGAGYHQEKSESENHSTMSHSLWSHGLYSPWNSPGQNTGVGSHSLLQGIFEIQESSWGLPHCRWILYLLNYQGSPSSGQAE